MLAGRLGPENVREAIARRPALGGRRRVALEREPGIKDHDAGARLRRGGAVDDAQSCSAPYGGRYVPETLIPALDELEAGWREALADDALPRRAARARDDLRRPADAAHAAPSGSRPASGIYLKREDLLHTGAHKLNNALGQAVLARRLGKQRIVAETGAGQHGVATATVCARFGYECVVYMGAEDMRRQKPNVERMDLLGAEVRRVEFGTKTLKEATSEAIRDWITNVETTHYLIGSCVGPAPYPEIVARAAVGDRPRGARADPRGGGPPARGRRRLRRRRLERDRHVRTASSTTRTCGSSASRPRARRRSAPAGRRAPRRALVDPRRRGRADRRRALDLGRARLSGRRPRARVPARHRPRASTSARPTTRRSHAFRRLARTEGIIPALEPSHALARARELDAELILVCLSGRGDKDLAEVLAQRSHEQDARRST